MKVLAPKTIVLYPVKRYEHMETASMFLSQIVVYKLYDIFLSHNDIYSIPVTYNLSISRDRILYGTSEEASRILEEYRYKIKRSLFTGVFDDPTSRTVVEDNKIIVLKKVNKFNLDENSYEDYLRSRYLS